MGLILGKGGVLEDWSHEAPLSAEVGEESTVSAFRLTGSPSCEGFCVARSFIFFAGFETFTAVGIDDGGCCEEELAPRS